MKAILYITLAVLLYSCGLVKDRQTAAQKSMSEDNSRTELQWAYADSSGRYWQYRSDSTFYYHPDRGLYAAGGELQALEQRRVNITGEIRRDSSSYRMEAQQSTQRKGRMPMGYRLVLWLGLFVQLLGYVVYRFYLGKKVK
jgi:hypothetical protein